MPMSPSRSAVVSVGSGLPSPCTVSVPFTTGGAASAGEPSTTPRKRVASRMHGTRRVLERERVTALRIVRQEGFAGRSIALRCARAHPHAPHRGRDAGRITPELRLHLRLQRATVGIPGDHRRHRATSVSQGARVDGFADLRVLGLGRLEDAAGIAQERVVTDGVDGIAHERVEARRPLLHASFDRREPLDVGREITRRPFRVDGASEGRSVDSESAREGAGTGDGVVILGLLVVVALDESQRDEEDCYFLGH